MPAKKKEEAVVETSEKEVKAKKAPAKKTEKVETEAKAKKTTTKKETAVKEEAPAKKAPAKTAKKVKVAKDTTIQFWGTGKRKKSVARVRLLQGNGKFTINGEDIAKYFPFGTLSQVATQPLTLLNVADKFDVVVNFAAESHVDRSISDPGIFVQTNVLGTQVLLDASKEYGVKRFHQVSTDEVYGDLPLDRPDLFFHEDTPLHTYP